MASSKLPASDPAPALAFAPAPAPAPAPAFATVPAPAPAPAPASPGYVNTYDKEVPVVNLHHGVGFCGVIFTF